MKSEDIFIPRRDRERARLDRLEWEELIARKTLLSRASWLQKGASRLLCAIGTYIVDCIHPARDLQGKYERAPSGMKRLVLSLQFKAAVELGYFGFYLVKHGELLKLRSVGFRELLLQVEDQSSDFAVPRTTVIGLAQSAFDLSYSGYALLERTCSSFQQFKKSIKIHWKNPSYEIERARLRASHGDQNAG